MIRLLVVVALVACSGGHSKAPGHPAPRPPDGGRGSQAVADAPTEQECDALLVHTLELADVERPAEQRLTEAEHATMLAQLRSESPFATACRAMTRTRFACALGAPSTNAMTACDD